MATCLGCIKRCFYTDGFSNASQLNRQPSICLDVLHMGEDVVLVKNGHRICGSGGALGAAPLVQNKSYFEMKLQQSGIWGVGVATRNTNLNSVSLGQDLDSWVLTSQGAIVHNKEVLFNLSSTVQEGDVIGVAFDHVELRFYLNGTDTNAHITGVKGEVYPVFYVDEGAILDAEFSTFYYQPPLGFEQIMIEQSLL